MQLAPLLASLVVLSGGGTLHRPPTHTPVATIATSAPPAKAVAADASARRRYHFLLWNLTTETINVHFASSLAGCSSDYNNIKPGQAFERGNYHDKWDRGKICAGACWTSVDAYTTSGNHHVVHFTPTSKFPQVSMMAGAGAANMAAGIALFAAMGPAAAVGMTVLGGTVALVGVLDAGGPCHGFDLAAWRDPKTGGWMVLDRYPGDYDVFKSQVLPNVGK